MVVHNKKSDPVADLAKDDFSLSERGKAQANAMEDAKVTYTLGYYPAGEEDNKFREIKVKVNRAGVTARYRNG